MKAPTFMGYPREDGATGTRNLLGVISTVSCANEFARWCSTGESVRTFYHGQGCCQTSPDLERVERTLVSLGSHPNLAGVLLVGLGCESVPVERLADSIAASGKPVETVVLQEDGGAERGAGLARERLERMRRDQLGAEREEVDLSSLLLGIKCGGSDTTSGLVSNPALGRAVDALLDLGGGCAFGETTELIGAEGLIVPRGRIYAVQREIEETILAMERRAERSGVDMRGGQPTGGNIKGGLSTIEEKSLGAAVKTGSHPIDGVVRYGDRIASKGLYFVDTPGREPEFLTGIAAAGAQLMCFTTGRGAPHGFPFMPIIKITGNPRTAAALEGHIDVDVSDVLAGDTTLDGAGQRILDSIISVASGERPKAEVMGYDQSMNIYATGPVI